MARSRILTLFSLIMVALTVSLSAQSIHTIVGGGTDDRRPAKEASLSTAPAGVVVDASGNVFVSDQLRHRVRRIDSASGIITTLAGTGRSGFSGDGGPADEAQLNRPTGLALDGEGRLYIADFGNERIRRVDLVRNTIETWAGNPTGSLNEGADRLSARTGVSEAGGIAVASNGDLYFADQARHVVRRIAGGSGAVTTVAGTFSGGFDGDGGATQRMLNGPVGLALSVEQNAIIVSDRGNLRLRRIDLIDGTITTIAGDGTPGGNPDGTTGASPLLPFVQGVSYDSLGILHVVGFEESGAGYVATLDDGLFRTVVGRVGAQAPADEADPREVSLERPQAIAFGALNQLFAVSSAILIEVTPDRQSMLVRAGEGRSIGDGGQASGAVLDRPDDVSIDAGRQLYVSGARDVRRIDLETGVIGTAASDLDDAGGVGQDSQRHVYFANGEAGLLLGYVPESGVVVIVAGGGEGLGDRVPAREAKFGHISSIEVAPDDSVYIGDRERKGVFRYDPVSSEVTRVAGMGTGDEGYTGDGGPATDARIGVPVALAVGADGTVFIGDLACDCVRRVDRATGIITTAAGGGTSSADGVPATSASFSGIGGLAVDTVNNLYVSTPGDGRIRFVSAGTGLVQTIAGGRVGDDGDGGPALGAAFSDVSGIEVLPGGSVVVADRLANRVRAIDSCESVGEVKLLAPSSGAVVDGGQVLLRWNAAEGAASYDVYIKEKGSPETLAAAGLSSTSHLVRNLTPGSIFEWRVVAFGDPYCSPHLSSNSTTRAFTSRLSCFVPGSFQLASPFPGNAVSGDEVEFSWTPSLGADRYEVFLGVTSPLVSVGTTKETRLTVRNLSPGSIYLWSVRAYAACDSSFSRTTDSREFGTTGSCRMPDDVQLVSPSPAGETVDPSRVTLAWTRANGAAGYDLYLGRMGQPSRLLHNLADTSVTLTGLEGGAEYTWRIEAFAGCDQSMRVASDTGKFTADSCAKPARPVIVAPIERNVPVGRPYVIGWREQTPGDASIRFVVERSMDGFVSVYDRQEVTGTSATFIAGQAGGWSHRVVAVGCAGAALSEASPVMRLTVAGETNEVRVVVPPRGVFVIPGSDLSGHATSLTLENPGTEALDLEFVRSSADGTPFFEMADPSGGVVTDFRLEAGETRKFLVMFGGPSADSEAHYEGFVAVYRRDARALRSPVFAYVSLRIGASGVVAPDILNAAGDPTKVVAFAPSSDPMVQESVVTIQLRNPGSVPLDLTAEVGPDGWLEPESGWNSSPIAPGASRSVRLRSRRDRAPAGALPRSSVIRFRAPGGESSRLLVVDPDEPPLRSGRGGEAAASELSRIVTRVTSRNLVQSRILATTLLLGNGGGDDLTVDLTFTPSTGSADPTISTTSVVVPAFETLAVIDPLLTWFGRSRPATGQLEIHTPADRFGTLTVEALEGVVQDGEATRRIPVVRSGEGAAPGLDRIAVLSELPSGTPQILLVETSGDEAKGSIEIVDAGGAHVASLDVTLPRSGYRVLSASDFALASLNTPFEAYVSATDGSIYAAILVDSDDGAAIIRSQPSQASSLTKSPREQKEQGGGGLLLPYVVNGPVAQGHHVEMRATTTFVAAGASAAQFRIRLITEKGLEGTANLTVEPRRPRAFGNVFFQLFGKTLERGALVVDRIGGSGRVVAMGVDDGAEPARVSDLPTIERGENPSAEEPTVFAAIDQSVDERSGHDWSLHLAETDGMATEVMVSVFDSTRPIVPLATKLIQVGAESRVEIADLLEWMGLSDPRRATNRPRLLCSVSKIQGAGRVSAAAVAVNRSSGVVQVHALTPSGGDMHTGLASKILPVKRAERRHPVRRQP